MPHSQSTEMQECIANCRECATICLETVQHCLELGGEHAAAEHITALLDCADLCFTDAALMARGSELSPRLCVVCAEACERCAESCERFPDDEAMRRCAEFCRRCAESCRRMAGMGAAT
jgi:hypothetical protein